MELTKLPHFKEFTPINHEPNLTTKFMNLFSVKFNIDNKEVEENVKGISILDNHLIITFSTFKKDEYLFDKEVIGNFLKTISTIDFDMMNNLGESIKHITFNNCKLVDITNLTYDYCYQIYEPIYVNAIIAYNN